MSKLPEIIKYIINGVFATAVHYAVLTLNMEILEFKSAGLANGVASIFGITSSFLGNRYFVFKGHTQRLSLQLSKFVALFIAIAILHSLTSFILTDIYDLNYKISFVVAVIIQLILGFMGSKVLVFNK